MNKKLMNVYYHCPQFLQTLGINIIEINQWKLQTCKEFKKWYTILKKIDHWKKEEFVSYQNNHLKKILSYTINHVPFYHDFYKKNNIDVSKVKTIDDLYKLPIVRKEDVQNHWNLFCSQKKEKYITRHTSGTTGKPLTIRISHSLDLLEKANAHKRNIWAGYDGSWIARLVGDNPIKDCNSKQLFRKSYVMKRVVFPTYCISFNTLPSIIRDLKKLGIKYLQCYPSAGYIIAKYLELNDEYLPLKAVLYSSEPMYDFQKKLIQERFQTKTFGFYGQAEEVISGVECEKGNYHLTALDGILEITKNGQNATAGEKGFTIATSLHNYAMPLIRYALNDYTGYCSYSCDCGRTSPLIYPIETKKEEAVITVDGRFISPSILTFPFKDQKGIIESQIIQKRIDSITIKIVKSDCFKQQNESQLINSIKKIVGNEMSIKIQYTDKIYRTKNQKKRFVLSELGEDILEKTFEEFKES